MNGGCGMSVNDCKWRMFYHQTVYKMVYYECDTGGVQTRSGGDMSRRRFACIKLFLFFFLYNHI